MQSIIASQLYFGCFVSSGGGGGDGKYRKVLSNVENLQQGVLGGYIAGMPLYKYLY